MYNYGQPKDVGGKKNTDKKQIKLLVFHSHSSYRKHYVSGIICQLGGKTYRYNRGLLNGFVNQLEKAHLVSEYNNYVSRAVKKI